MLFCFVVILSFLIEFILCMCCCCHVLWAIAGGFVLLGDLIIPPWKPPSQQSSLSASLSAAARISSGPSISTSREAEAVVMEALMAPLSSSVSVSFLDVEDMTLDMSNNSPVPSTPGCLDQVSEVC